MFFIFLSSCVQEKDIGEAVVVAKGVEILSNHALRLTKKYSKNQLTLRHCVDA